MHYYYTQTNSYYICNIRPIKHRLKSKFVKMYRQNEYRRDIKHGTNEWWFTRMSAPLLWCARTLEKNDISYLQQQQYTHSRYNTATTYYRYCINYIKKNFNRTATGICYRVFASRAGALNICVSMQKKNKKAKNNNNLYRNVSGKNGQKGKKIERHNICDDEYLQYDKHSHN